MSHETIELVIISIAAFALLIQSVFMVAMFFGVVKGLKMAKQEIDEIKGQVMPVIVSLKPIIESTREAIVRITPKIEATVTNISDLAQVVRNQAGNVESSVEQIMVRVNKQTSRIDSMVSATLDAVDKATVFVTKAVGKPVRQFSGLMAGLRAMVDALGMPSANRAGRQNSSFQNHQVSNDKDLFV